MPVVPRIGESLSGPDSDTILRCQTISNRDILAWSRHQANLLRRLARGERVNEVDWEHVVEDVGLSELNAVRSYLRLMLVHLLKVHCWPDSPSVGHWRGEIVSFRADAAQRFAPPMRRRINLERLYRTAREQVQAATYDERERLPSPEACPLSLDQLLNEPQQALETVLAGTSES